MRNATVADVEEAKRTGVLKEDIMYGVYKYKVHGKKYNRGLLEAVNNFVPERKGRLVIAETSDGEVLDVDPFDIYPLSSGPSQQPKKVKRKPQRGTRPEKLIPFTEGMTLKVGDKVILSDGKRVGINTVDTVDDSLPYESEGRWYEASGKCCVGSLPSITHVAVPYKEWNKSVPTSYEEECFNKGWWVGFLANPDSVMPSFLDGKQIEIMAAKSSTTTTALANAFIWDVDQYGSIVAYRKAP